eukprot:CAMPEP_0113840850 /NCGR_PEP_ID=MMETSP0328-20130328/11836_1 /TAXON_ID=39455 /ORGANISM="Alexandrium minutum" /LENGTH=56 /DNA_ID=CAMNT_0000809565 /DNA_START=5 /DNA_END=172 /DNA_ORIENTATION=+ /assembly_acc=CAM_ASM_000350
MPRSEDGCPEDLEPSHSVLQQATSRSLWNLVWRALEADTEAHEAADAGALGTLGVA